MDNYHRETIIEALSDFRRKFDARDPAEKCKIETINEAEEGIKSLTIPQNKSETIWYAIEAFEELLGFDLSFKDKRFVKSAILTLKTMMIECQKNG